MLPRGLAAAAARLPRGGRLTSAGGPNHRRRPRGTSASCCAGRARDCCTARALRTPTTSVHPPRSAATVAFPALNDNCNNDSWDASRRHLSSSPKFDGSGNIVKPVSEAQRRSAALELERMNRSTARLLDMTITSDSDISEATVNEARVALHYWSRRWYLHFHPGFGRAAKGSALSLEALRRWDGGNAGSGGGRDGGEGNAAGSDITVHTDPKMSELAVGGDRGAKQAERLLDWALSHNLVPRGIFDNSDDEVSYIPREDKEGGSLGISPNLTCVNIIETYLLPTAYGGVGGGGDESGTADPANDHATLAKHFVVTPSYVRAVADASRILNKMKRLQSEFPDVLSPDTLSVKAELNVWAKRAIVLGGPPDAFGGGGNVGDAGERLKRLESTDAVAAGGETYDDGAYAPRGCLEHMESVLARAEERYLSANDERIRPSVDWYNHLLGALARSRLPGALDEARRILRGMEACDDDLLANRTIDDGSVEPMNVRRCHARPDTVSYNSVLFCLAGHHAGKDGAKEAEELLRRMTERHRRRRATGNGGSSDAAPDEVTYGAVLHALARAGLADEAERILDSLEGPSSDVLPTLTIYNTVLNAWATSRARRAPRRAEALLHRMRTMAATGRNPAVAPDGVSVATVISCHARGKTRRGAERGEEMLDEAMAMHAGGNARAKPDAIMFNCAITGWTNISGIESERGGSGDAIPGERAERLLRRMKEFDVRPGTQTFNIILDCWANSGVEGAAERALSLLKEMPDYGVTPDEISYNSALHAMTKESDPKWVHRAEAMFQDIKGKANISQITYHVMMNIYGKCTDAEGATKAEEFLRRMEQDGFSASDISYNICIDAYARRGDHQRAEKLLGEMISLSEQGKECRPTIHSFASVINALAKSGDVDAVARAEEVVRKVEELSYVSSNSILYNSLIDCIVKSRREDSASRADEILLKMEEMNRSGNRDVSPNSYAYSMVLTCCARSSEPDAAERAERILMNMERLYADGISDAAANSRCYSAAISAWARSTSPDAVERALALIDRMEKNGRDGSPHGKPNAHCYNAALNAIAKSQQPGKARKCRDILERMTTARDEGFLEAAPSQVTHSTIINACAYTNGDDEERKEAFDLARTCFQSLLESEEMSSATFTNFFLVISRHLKRGAIRDHLVSAVYLEGQKRGTLDRQALTAFRKASPAVAERLL